MASYNRTFDLSLEDLDLIETALQSRQRSLSDARLSGEDTATDKVRDIHALLGRLHNQKQFYRPKSGVYVGG